MTIMPLSTIQQSLKGVRASWAAHVTGLDIRTIQRVQREPEWLPTAHTMMRLTKWAEMQNEKGPNK